MAPLDLIQREGLTRGSETFFVLREPSLRAV